MSWGQNGTETLGMINETTGMQVPPCVAQPGMACSFLLPVSRSKIQPDVCRRAPGYHHHASCAWAIPTEDCMQPTEQQNKMRRIFRNAGHEPSGSRGGRSGRPYRLCWRPARYTNWSYTVFNTAPGNGRSLLGQGQDRGGGHRHRQSHPGPFCTVRAGSYDAASFCRCAPATRSSNLYADVSTWTNITARFYPI